MERLLFAFTSQSKCAVCLFFPLLLCFLFHGYFQCPVRIAKLACPKMSCKSFNLLVSWCGYLRAVRDLCEGEHFNPWPFLRLQCVPCLVMPAFAEKERKKIK